MQIILEPEEVTSSVKRIVNHFLKHRQSFNTLEDVCKVVNLTPKAAVQVPTTKYKIKQFIEPTFACNFHIECMDCKHFSEGAAGEIACCGKKLKTANTNHFVTISLKEQLARSIINNFDEIAHLNRQMKRMQLQMFMIAYNFEISRKSFRAKFYR